MRPSEEDLIDAYGIIRRSDEEEPGHAAGNIFLSALIIVLIANVKALHNRFGSGDMCSYYSTYLRLFVDEVKPNRTSHHLLRFVVFINYT